MSQRRKKKWELQRKMKKTSQDTRPPHEQRQHVRYQLVNQRQPLDSMSQRWVEGRKRRRKRKGGRKRWEDHSKKWMIA
jgi:hypothetical protein